MSWRRSLPAKRGKLMASERNHWSNDELWRDLVANREQLAVWATVSDARMRRHGYVPGHIHRAVVTHRERYRASASFLSARLPGLKTPDSSSRAAVEGRERWNRPEVDRC